MVSDIIRVVLADDHTVVRAGLKAVLGGAKDIQETAQHQYGVTFPITAKTVVRGPDAHPFYKWAAAERPADVPRWNFHKYLIGGDGLIADVFASDVEPMDPPLIAAIERESGTARPSN